MIATYKTITQIPVELWEQLEIKNPLCLYGWLSTVEECYLDSIGFRYFVLWENEQIACAAISYILDRRTQFSEVEKVVFGRVQKLLKNFRKGLRPILYCGHLKGWGTSVVFHQDTDHEHQIGYFKQILEGIESFASQHSCNITFAKLYEQNSTEFKVLESSNYIPFRNLPVNLLNIRWRNFEE